MYITNIGIYEPKVAADFLGLLPDSMSIGPDLIIFRFIFYNGGFPPPTTGFTFRSFTSGGVVTPNPSQSLQAIVRQGPSSLGAIPTQGIGGGRVSAVLMTVSAAVETIALPTHRVQLKLEGYTTWEWDIRFEAPVSPFRLDGIWG